VKELINTEAERGILGSILVSSVFTPTIMPVDLAMDKGCGEDWFTDRKNRVFWAVLKDMHIRNKPIDMVTVGAELKKNDGSDGWWEYMEGLTEDTPTYTNVEEYLDIAHTKQMQRGLRSLAQDMLQKAEEEGADVDQIVAEASVSLTEVVTTGVVRTTNMLRKQDGGI
jgi:replicative DNA helicase